MKKRGKWEDKGKRKGKKRYRKLEIGNKGKNNEADHFNLTRINVAKGLILKAFYYCYHDSELSKLKVMKEGN